MEGITVLDRRPRLRYRLEVQARWIMNRIIYLITEIDMKQKFKPFDLEARQGGAPVMTRDGRPARGFPRSTPKADEYPIAAAIESYDGESEGIRTRVREVR